MITSFIVAITLFSRRWTQRSIFVELWLPQAIRTVRHMMFGSRHCRKTNTHRLIDLLKFGVVLRRLLQHGRLLTHLVIQLLSQENQSQDTSKRLLDRSSDGPAREESH